MSVQIDGFRRAMKAALEGPELKDVEWSSFRHDFNVKRVDVTKTAEGLTIDGRWAQNDGDVNRHISHRRKWRPDDQVSYWCRVTKEGKVEDLQVSIKSSMDTLIEWFKTAGELAQILYSATGPVDAARIEPTPSSLELMDGDWEGDVDFLIANIIAAVVARDMPELRTTPRSDFTVMRAVVNPTILARFLEARAHLAES